MSNRKEHYLPELELPVAQVREALQCLLHTILFIRAPGTVAPLDVHLEDFDLTYSKIDTTKEHAQTVPSPSSLGGSYQYSNSNPNDAINNPHPIDPLEQRVENVIDSVLRSLVPIGPDLSQGGVMLSFFEKRATKQLFGFMKHEEKVVFESWILKVVVSSRDTITPRPHQQQQQQQHQQQNNQRRQLHHSKSLGSSPGSGAGAKLMNHHHRLHSADQNQQATAMSNNSHVASMERQRVRDMAEQMVRAAMLEIFDKVGECTDHIPPVMYEFELNVHNKPVGDDYRESIRSRVNNMPTIMKLNIGS